MIEAERAAIAAEIHDGLLPYLYAAAAKLAAIRRSTHADSHGDGLERLGNRLDERLADAANWIDQSREVARALMNGITYPPQALADPLAAAQAFLRQFTDLSEDGLPENRMPEMNLPVAGLDADSRSPTVHWQWGDGPSPLAGRLPATSAIAVYRLTTEFVRNALRHAEASRIEVSASLFNGIATVQIQDDGCGFNPREVDLLSSHGLALARVRAETAGIELQLESQHESDRAAPPGTCVTLRTAFSTSGQPDE